MKKEINYDKKARSARKSSHGSLIFYAASKEKKIGQKQMFNFTY